MTFTTDPAARLQATADALATVFASVGAGATALAYDPVGIEIPSPCIAVGEASGAGTAIDASGHQIGKDDQAETWTVRLYHYLDDPAADWAAARSLIGLMRQVLDADFDLGGQVREARITSWTLAPYVADPAGARRLLIGECTVSVLYLMSSS